MIDIEYKINGINRVPKPFSTCSLSILRVSYIQSFLVALWVPLLFISNLSEYLNAVEHSEAWEQLREGFLALVRHHHND